MEKKDNKSLDILTARKMRKMPAHDVNPKPTFPESDPAFQEVPDLYINEVGMNH